MCCCCCPVLTDSSPLEVESEIKTAATRLSKKQKTNRWVTIVLIVLLFFLPFIIVSILVPPFYNDDAVWYGTLFGVLNIVSLFSVASYFFPSHIYEDEALSTPKMVFLILKQLFIKLKLFFPTITHFADTGSDIGLLIEFYKRISNDNDTDDGIDYEWLFYVSLIIMVLYRLISSFMVYNFTHNKFDTLLQFFDFYLFKVIRLSIEKNNRAPTIIQKWIRLLESLLESAPQALIAVYILLRTYRQDRGFFDSVSPIVLISSVLSILSIIYRVITEDEYFLKTDKFKNVDFSFKKISKLQCINYKYFIRVFWRYCDIVSHILIYALSWILFGGWIPIVFLSVSLIISLGFSKTFQQLDKTLGTMILDQSGNELFPSGNKEEKTVKITQDKPVIVSAMSSDESNDNKDNQDKDKDTDKNGDYKDESGESVYYRYFGNNFDFSLLSAVVFAVPINPFEFHRNMMHFVIVVAFRWIYQIVLFILIFKKVIFDVGGLKNVKDANETYASALLTCVICWIIQIILYFYFSFFQMNNAAMTGSLSSKKNAKLYTLAMMSNAHDWNILTHYGYQVNKEELYEYYSFLNFDDPLWIINEIILKNDEFKGMVNEKIQFRNSWHGILCNSVLSEKNEEYWQQLCEKANVQLFINERYEKMHFEWKCSKKCHPVLFSCPSDVTLFWEAVRCQHNVHFIQFLVKNYNISLDPKIYEKMCKTKKYRMNREIKNYLGQLVNATK